MTSYAEALKEFYNGEILGEAFYSALLPTAQTDDQRLKLATLLQLETETKAWLRPHLIAQSLSIEELASERDKGLALAAQIKPLPWQQFMKSAQRALEGQVVPLYQGFADAAKARGEAAEEAVCIHMVEHEMAQVELAKRELAGKSARDVLEPVTSLLKYPVVA